MVLGRRDYHVIDQDSRDHNLSRRQRAVIADPLNLNNDRAATVFNCHGHAEVLQNQTLFLETDIAGSIGGGAAQQADIDWKRSIAQIFLSINNHDLDQILCSDRIDLAALDSRVDKGFQTNSGECPRPFSGNITNQVGDGTLRKIVGLDFVIQRHLA